MKVFLEQSVFKHLYLPDLPNGLLLIVPQSGQVGKEVLPSITGLFLTSPITEVVRVSLKIALPFFKTPL